MTFQTRNLVRNFRRAGPPALLAACLAVGPSFAQSTTVTTTDPAVERSKTTIKEKPNGDTVVKKKETDGDATVKSKTTIKDKPSTTTTVVR